MSKRSIAVAVVSLILMGATHLRMGKPVAAPPPTIDPLPAGWTREKDSEKSHGGIKGTATTGFQATAEEKSDSLDNQLTFEAWCKNAQERDIKDCPLYQEKDTPMKAEKIGDRTVMVFDSTGTLMLAPMHFRTYYIELPDKFARIVCWSDADKWAAVEPDLDGLVKNLK